MNLKTFKASIKKNKKPPKGISPALEALWFQARGDWDTAHQIAQSEKNPMGFLVHAYLHRAEGAIENAAYWYQLAGKPVSTSSLGDEWEEIVDALV